MRAYLIVFTLFVLFSSSSAQAYIGPGLGAGTVGVVLGILGSIFLTFLAVIYYPIKRMFRKRKEKQQGKDKCADKDRDENASGEPG